MIRPNGPPGPIGPHGPDLPHGPGPTLPNDGQLAFAALDEGLPLALFPVRLEARFLPDDDPVEIVVRVFPDHAHLDRHDPALTPAELAVATSYWETVWRAGEEGGAAVTEANRWLAAQLGAGRAVYVATVTRPAGDLPSRPTPAGEPLRPPLAIPDVPVHPHAGPGRARLLPVRWAAYVDQQDEEVWNTFGPFWATKPVRSDLTMTPALVALGENADAREFLSAQGLDWTHDLTAAEDAGLVIRIPVTALPELPDGDDRGYHRLYVLGAAHGDAAGEVAALLDAHRCSGGLDLLVPGTPTNTTASDPLGSPAVDLDALFGAVIEAKDSKRTATHPRPSGLQGPTELLRLPPAPALGVALGLGDGAAALDLTPGGDPEQPGLARAANQALWPATWGKWLTDPMRWATDGSPLIERRHIDAVRAWFVDWVRSDGPFCSLRIGDQPYGVLPTTAFAPGRSGTTTHAYLKYVLGELLGHWAGALALDAVPLLDPDAHDVAPDGTIAEDASDVGAVLGATPHLREFRVRTVGDDHGELRDLYNARIWFAKLLCALVPDRHGKFVHPDELDAHPWYTAFDDRQPDIEGANGVDAQYEAITDVMLDLEGFGGFSGTHEDGSAWSQEKSGMAVVGYLDFPSAIYDEEDHAELYAEDDVVPAVVTGDVRPMVGRLMERLMIEPAGSPWDLLAELGASAAMGVDDTPRLRSASYGEEGTEQLVTVLVARDDESPEQLAGWLDAVADATDAFASGGDRPTYTHNTEGSLLYHLVHSAAESVGRQQAAMVVEGVRRLRDFVTARGSAAVTELERLMRATLGLASYRLDAWLTSLATQQLAALRVKRPTGLQVGGYGWLVNVRRRRGRASQGHIHAPSLDQATTAAVLRSGWSAFGTDAGGHPLAVDLSSQRVRAATSLIEGVRSGLELGRLLGAGFERRLHDRGLDRYIDDVRSAVLAGAGMPNRPPTRVVDGLLLARAFTDGITQTGAELAVHATVSERIGGIGGVHDAIRETVADLDAVADVLFAQSVHALIRGDPGVAPSTLAATGSGDAGLPSIDLPSTRLGGSNVTVRIVGFLADGTDDTVAWPGAAVSVLAALDPRLEAWVGRLLGDPARVVGEVDVAGRTSRFTMDAIGLGALDAVYRGDELDRIVLAALGLEDGRILEGRSSDLEPDALSFDELVTLMRDVHRAVGYLRPLSRADVVGATAPNATNVTDHYDVPELQGRLDEAVRRLPATDARHAALNAHIERHPGETYQLVAERMRIVAGVDLPVLAVLEDGVPSEVRASSLARSTNSLGVAGWLAQAARVRPRLAPLVRAIQLAELLRDDAQFGFSVAQFPDPGGPWVGSDAPSTAGPHTAWCSINGPMPDGPVVGFVADGWSEVIPARKVSTGIAVLFDRPQSQAPNAVLLDVAGAEPFSIDQVLGCLRHTLTLSQLRAVGADQLRGTGQFLPAVFLPDDVAFAEVAS